MRSPTQSTVCFGTSFSVSSKSNMSNAAESLEPPSVLSDSDRHDRDNSRRSAYRRFERHEIGIIASAPKICGLGLREILVAVVDRGRHVDIFDRRRPAERSKHCVHQVAEAARHAGADVEDARYRWRFDQPAHDRDRVFDIDEIAFLLAVSNAGAMGFE